MFKFKIFVSIFAIFLSLFFLTGCFEKKEDVNGKNNVKTTETKSKEKDTKKEENISNVEPRLKEAMVVRPGGYGIVLPDDYVVDTSASKLVYLNKAENIKVEFSENEFGRNISIQEFGGYAQNLLKNIAQTLEVESVESDKYTDYPFFVISAHSKQEKKNFLIYGFLANNNETAYMTLWEFNEDNPMAKDKIKNIAKTFSKH